MLRNIGKALFCIGGLMSSCAFATTHVLVKGMSMSYELPVNEPQVFANFLLWSITAKCTINDADDNTDINVSGISKNGKINGNALGQGQSVLITVRPGDLLEVYAVAGARVELTNKGVRLIKARCTT